jgi:drug/metabolite transporter (DMT)-like permease
MHDRRIRATLKALLAAALFGASVPLSKVLVQDVNPVPLAGLLYMGSGLCAGVILAGRRLMAGRSGPGVEAGLRGRDIPVLAGAVLTGGVAAPIALMHGLRTTPAATASLLLAFEVAATALIAALVFSETIGPRVWVAVGLVTVGSGVLSGGGADEWGISVGALAILAASCLWGLDNNLTRLVSGKDPMAIVLIKGAVAGAFSLILAANLGIALPSLRVAMVVTILGGSCYGLSIALFVQSLRELGAARTGALFGSAPFFGAVLSFLVLRESPGAPFLVALPLIAVGVALLLGESHRHEHHHHEIVHEHRHSHDDLHHGHVHAPEEISAGGHHSHLHRHAGTTHTHPHTPDLHHRHDHPQE